ncbi:MAG: glycine--tRNA ligase subunit beta [Coxiellaceae bacterium]|nr:glycine--tRNA ligase subunit beta [Coxiellaceae bacterium]
MKQDFLFEIGCEELPPHTQRNLSRALQEQFSQVLSDTQLSFAHIKVFATPRRLAVLIQGLATTQSAQTMERQGPAVQDAFDKNGTPTLMCLGFAKSCGVSVDQLIEKETPKGKRLVCICEKPGLETKIVLPELLIKVISKLPLPKPMRWGNHTTAFIRPVHWVIALFGDELIHTEILGKKTTRDTFGHRFMHPKAIRITKPSDYATQLYTQGFVIADQDMRKNAIRKQINTVLAQHQTAIVDDNLLNEVTGLVEWPVVLKGSFDSAFLSVPKECLMTAMETHQKCFPVIDQYQQLLPYFILVSNIASKDPDAVIKGNERVIRARLSDAAFFYQQDCKSKLSDKLEKLETVVFQDQLGNLGEKMKRISTLAEFIATQVNADASIATRAATLSKCDLMTGMVSEFPDLQGTMGYYYALREKESENTAIAIRDHYYPKFSGDGLPTTLEGCCVAIADRIDTLVGVLGIGKFPTGDKDPFALRRAALSILRIIIEKNIAINMVTLLEKSQKLYGAMLTNKNAAKDVFDFMMTRLKSWYLDKNISVEVFESVLARAPQSLLDFDQRVKAVIQFQHLPESVSLAAANKRVNNILKKLDKKTFKKPNPALFELDAERELEKQLLARKVVVDALYDNADYENALTELSILKQPIDAFFEHVMIMVDDAKKKENRLALLSSIRELMTKVADISLLPS